MIRLRICDLMPRLRIFWCRLTGGHHPEYALPGQRGFWACSRCPSYGWTDTPGLGTPRSWT